MNTPPASPPLRTALLLCALLALCGCATFKGGTPGPEAEWRPTDALSTAGGADTATAPSRDPAGGPEAAGRALRDAARTLRQGRAQQAVWLAVQALSAFKLPPGGEFPFLLLISQAQLRLQNPALAEQALRMALQRVPVEVTATERLGLLLASRTDDPQSLDEATELLERTVRLDPSRWRAHEGLGIIAAARGRHDMALVHHDRAHALAPAEVSVLDNRGYCRLLADDLTGARRDLEQALARGGSPATRLNLARLEAASGHPQRALDLASKEVGLAGAHNLVGEIALARNELLTAAHHLEQAVELSARHFEAAERNLERLDAALLDGPPGTVARVLRRAPVQTRRAMGGVLQPGDTVELLGIATGSALVRFRTGTGELRTGWVRSDTVEPLGRGRSAGLLP